jgi:hypothetical protein
MSYRKVLWKILSENLHGKYILELEVPMQKFFSYEEISSLPRDSLDMEPGLLSHHRMYCCLLKVLEVGVF